MDFEEKYSIARKKKSSVLCTGLDPASIFFKETDSVPRKYFEKASETQALLDFCLDAVEKISGECAAFKLNAQYAMPFSLAQMQQLNERIAAAGCLSIYDLKLSDIGSSNESACYWMRKAGFDAFTFSPYAGNVEATSAAAHKAGLGIFVLALMSNPEAKYFMRDSTVEGVRGYQWVCTQAKSWRADGVVAGATNDGTELAEIRSLVGAESVILIPGVGRQGGSLEAVAKAGSNVLVNVGRDLIYSDDPAKKAAEYRKKFNEFV